MPLNVPNQRILTKKNSFTLSNIMFSLQHLNIEKWTQKYHKVQFNKC